MAETEKRELNPNFLYLEKSVPKNRWTLLQGGTRSGKTFSTLQYIIKLCLECKDLGLEIDIVRSTYKALKATVWKDMEDLLKQYGLYHTDYHNKTEHIYQLNGNFINYYGTDDAQKVHGRKRDILYCNEVNQIDEDTIDQLAPRTTRRIIGDYNPAIGDDHWLDRYIEKFPPLITTYKDNPFLTPEQIEDIESKKDKEYWWAVYGCGERAKREGVIFPNWVKGQMDESLPRYRGIDFGFKNDPDGCVEVAIDEKRMKIYVKEVFYNYRQTIDELSYQMKKLGKLPIVADSAEQRLINHLAVKTGHTIFPVKKKPGSVIQGIRIMENYQIVVCGESPNLVRELNNYCWSQKDAPIDDYNHLIDSIRYVVWTFGKLKYNENKDTRSPKRDKSNYDSAPWVNNPEAGGKATF